MNSNKTAPAMEKIQFEKLQKLSGFAKPIRPAIKPPSILPKIPTMMVINHPAGSDPGLNILAIAPAINPKTIHPSQLII